jgi:putative SOS response-associated peptidase YedK
MCDLNSLTKSQHCMRQFFKVTRDKTGHMPPPPANFPVTMAPVAHEVVGARVLDRMRWGFPPLKDNRPVTNVRNLADPHWHRWLKPEFRGLVPVTSFCARRDARPRGQLLVYTKRVAAAVRSRWNVAAMDW